METEKENRKCCSIVVFGRVQGVGYRYSAQRAAARLGIGGWVRNNSDGSVELECEGDGEKITEFIDWLRNGPPYSRVTSMDVREKPCKGVYRGFSIEY